MALFRATQPLTPMARGATPSRTRERRRGSAQAAIMITHRTESKALYVLNEVDSSLPTCA